MLQPPVMMVLDGNQQARGWQPQGGPGPMQGGGPGPMGPGPLVGGPVPMQMGGPMHGGPAPMQMGGPMHGGAAEAGTAVAEAAARVQQVYSHRRVEGGTQKSYSRRE